MKTVREGPISVYPRGQGVIDVFTGTGWEKHSVFKIVKGHPRLESGAPLSEKEFTELKEMVK